MKQILIVGQGKTTVTDAIVKSLEDKRGAEMTSCPNKIGTYVGQVELIFPEHQMRKNAGYYIETKSCWVDSCIADEISNLWSQGIVTLGSCCGHGVNEGMINVLLKDAEKMVELEYEKLKVPEGCWEYTYKPKSKHKGEVQE